MVKRKWFVGPISQRNEEKVQAENPEPALPTRRSKYKQLKLRR